MRKSNEYILAIEKLEREKEALRDELWKYKSKPTGKIGSILLFFGTILITLALISGSQIAAFIGISLIFWGGLFHFIKPTKYIKIQLLSSTTILTLVNLYKIISTLNYNGNGIHLPLTDLNKSQEKLFIPYKNGENNISENDFFIEGEIFQEQPKGVLITPTGSDLADFFEEELGIYFSKTDIETLQKKLPKLFTEGLEVAESFEINRNQNNIQIKISNSPYIDMFTKVLEDTENSFAPFLFPFFSSIACILTRSSQKPIIMNNYTFSKNFRTLDIDFQMQGEIRINIPVKQPIATSELNIQIPKKTKKYSPTPNIIDLIALGLGSIFLALFAWLVIYDAFEWNKDIITILFSSRAGEGISLGIGLRVIHYLFLGSAMYVFSVIQFFRKKKNYSEE
jgi:hypothetical protein